MPEIKTFKNPLVEKSASFRPGWYVSAKGDRSDGQHFRQDEWDMEVILTKKPEPRKFKAGDRVDSTGGTDEPSGDPGTVVGYRNGQPLVVWDINLSAIQPWDEDELIRLS